jgi:hypothetical protein
MVRLIGVVITIGLVFALCRSAAADESKDAQAIIDRAVRALGGAKSLGAIKAATWNAKSKIFAHGTEDDFKNRVIVQGLDYFRQEYEGELEGRLTKGVNILAGNKGWRKDGDNVQKLENYFLVQQKRFVYLQIIPMTLLPLKEQRFRVVYAGEEKLGDRPAVILKVTGPEGEDFQLFFDKASGLPVKEAATLPGARRKETFKQESTFSNYKDFGGIKRATKIETWRNGEKFMEQEIVDFKILDKVEPSAFAEP